MLDVLCLSIILVNAWSISPFGTCRFLNVVMNGKNIKKPSNFSIFSSCNPPSFQFCLWGGSSKLEFYWKHFVFKHCRIIIARNCRNIHFFLFCFVLKNHREAKNLRIDCILSKNAGVSQSQYLELVWEVFVARRE